MTIAVLALLILGTACERGAGGDSPEQQSRKHFQRARELMDRGDQESGLVHMKRALQFDPNYAPIHHDLGEYYFDTGTNYPEALYHFRRVLEIQPDHVLRGTIEQRIQYCKMEIGEGSIPLDGSSSLVNQVKELTRKLTEERARRMELESQYAEVQNRLSQPAQPDPSSTEQPGAERPSNRTTTPSTRTGSGPVPVSTTRVREATVIAPPSETRTTSGNTTVHVLQQGETLYRLSRQYGVSVRSIEEANPSLVPTNIPVGTRINIPQN